MQDLLCESVRARGFLWVLFHQRGELRHLGTQPIGQLHCLLAAPASSCTKAVPMKGGNDTPSLAPSLLPRLPQLFATEIVIRKKGSTATMVCAAE